MITKLGMLVAATVVVVVASCSSPGPTVRAAASASRATRQDIQLAAGEDHRADLRA